MSTATIAPHTPGSSQPPVNPCLYRIRDLIYHEAGIFYTENKLRTLQEQCDRRASESSLAGLQAYCDYLTTNPRRHSELINLLNLVTVGETYFFRNQAQLDALRRIVLPRIAEAKGRSPFRRMRIWSAGCSTGEEPYTLAMILLEEKSGVLKDFGLEVQATDLNEYSLAQAKKGVYDEHSVRNVTPYLRQKYFTSAGSALQINPAVQSIVSFSRVNLFETVRMSLMKDIDVIFCCNVLIYFDAASKKAVIQHFHGSLMKHGYLFLGNSESLYGTSDDFRLVHLPSATAYVKTERGSEVTK